MVPVLLATLACTCMAYVMLLYHAVVKQPLSFLHTSLFPSLCSYFDSLRPHHSQKTYPGAATVQTASTAAADNAALTHLPTPEQLSSLIKARRSIFPKHMTGETVPQDSIATMLEAANWAPTHGRTEPWRFVVLGKAGMEAMQLLTEDIFRQQLIGRPEILQNVLSGLRQDRLHRWQPVSHMIAICMARQPKPDKLMPLWEELAAVACAVQNMHLMATSLGVAAYWSSWHDTARDSPEMLSFLGLDYTQGDRCWGFLILGRAEAEVVQSYRSSRGAVMDKVVFMD